MKGGDLERKDGVFRRRLIDVIIILALVVIALYAVLLHFRITGQGMDNIIASALVGIAIIEVMGAVVYFYFARRIALEEAGPLRNLFRIIAYCFLVIVILAELHVNVTGILVSAGFLGIVLGLAAQSTLSNFISGVYLLSSKAFEPGDRVIIHTWQYNLIPPSYPHDKFIPGFSGTIMSIGVLYTEITNDERLPMLVPNNIVAQALVINYHRAKEHLTKVQFNVDIRIRFTDLERKIKAVVSKNKGKIDQYTIDIEYLSKDLYVVTIHMKMDELSRARIKTEIYMELIKYLNKEHAKLN